MKIKGTAANNKNGHLGIPPTGTSRSPQSQIVPSTSASSTTSTPYCCGSWPTVTEDNSPPCGTSPEPGLTVEPSDFGAPFDVDPFVPAGSCETIRFAGPWFGCRLWTT